MLWLRRAGHVPALLAGGRVREPVFIVGAPRSGTSLLYAIVRSSPVVAHWPGEAHEIWEADFHPALRGWSSNALDASDARDPAAERIKRSFFLVAGPRRRLVDKTPRNSLRVPFVDALFPDARFVLLVRDGRDNVNSLLNAWRTPRYRTYRLPEPHSIPGVDPAWWKFVLYPGWRADADGPLEVVCARQWTASNEHALDALGGIDARRWTTVRYEGLVADPAGVAEEVLSSLGLPFDDSMRRRARELAATPINAVTPPEEGKWRRENRAEIEAVMPLLAPALERLGYR